LDHSEDSGKIPGKHRVSTEEALVRDGVLTAKDLEKKLELFRDAQESSG
jgi:hypothetical protein